MSQMPKDGRKTEAVFLADILTLCMPPHSIHFPLSFAGQQHMLWIHVHHRHRKGKHAYKTNWGEEGGGKNIFILQFFISCL